MKFSIHFVLLFPLFSRMTFALPADTGTLTNHTEHDFPNVSGLEIRRHENNIYEGRSSDDSELFERNATSRDTDTYDLESRAKIRPNPPTKTTRPAVLGPQSKPTFKSKPKPKPKSKPKCTSKPPAQTPVYTISCSKYPNVCQNWCFYAYCKKTASGDPWTVTVDRDADLRSQSDCKTPNRCSTADAGAGWPKNPNSNWSCDEQPKNTNSEGGAGAATRCMPKGENSGEGGKWAGFINKKNACLPDGTKAKVQLDFAGTAESGFCKKQCTAPVKSDSQGVDKDGPRQR